MTTEINRQVVCLGEALIDLIPQKQRDHLKDATLLRKIAGGATANVSVGLARLGSPSAFMGKVGDDPLGYFLRDTLVQQGVDVSQMLFDPATNTGLAFGWVETPATGEAKYLFFKLASADRLLRADELDLNFIQNAAALQYGSLLLAAEPSATALRLAIETAGKARVPRIYDVNLRLPAWQSAEIARRGMLSLLDEADIIKLNRHELRFLTNETDLPAGVAKIWRNNCKLLVVTLDSDGCYLQCAAGNSLIAGLKVNVADTVGCGDAFVAALIHYIQGQGGFSQFRFDSLPAVEKACRYANAAGAYTALRAGAIPAMPNQRQLARFYAKVYPGS